MASTPAQASIIDDVAGYVFNRDRVVGVADQTTYMGEENGVGVTVSHSGQRIHVINPVDRVATSAEALATVRFTVHVTNPAETAVDLATLEAGYDVGCGVGIDEPVGLAVGSTAGVSPHLGSHISGGPQVSVAIPTSGVNVGGQGQVGVDSGLDGQASITPQVTMKLLPGGVTRVPLISQHLDGDAARLSAGFSQARIHVTGCVGEVAIRSYATATIHTADSGDTASVYGDSIRIN